MLLGLAALKLLQGVDLFPCIGLGMTVHNFTEEPKSGRAAITSFFSKSDSPSKDKVCLLLLLHACACASQSRAERGFAVALVFKTVMRCALRVSLNGVFGTKHSWALMLVSCSVPEECMRSLARVGAIVSCLSL